jgi:hypothetical protein
LDLPTDNVTLKEVEGVIDEVLAWLHTVDIGRLIKEWWVSEMGGISGLHVFFRDTDRLEALKNRMEPLGKRIGELGVQLYERLNPLFEELGQSVEAQRY